jgi:hypothetical protein
MEEMERFADALLWMGPLMEALADQRTIGAFVFNEMESLLEVAGTRRVKFEFNLPQRTEQEQKSHERVWGSTEALLIDRSWRLKDIPASLQIDPYQVQIQTAEYRVRPEAWLANLLWEAIKERKPFIRCAECERPALKVRTWQSFCTHRCQSRYNIRLRRQREREEAANGGLVQ